MGAFGDFGGAVDLFGGDKAGESVRKDQSRKAPNEVSFHADFVIKAISAADKDYNFAAIHESTLQPLGIFV